MTLDPLEPRPRSVMEPVWSRRDGRERDRHRDRERETEGDRKTERDRSREKIKF